MPRHRTARANPASPTHASSENLLFKMKSCYSAVSILLGPFLLSLSQMIPSTTSPETKKRENFAAVALRHGTSGAAFLAQRSGG